MDYNKLIEAIRLCGSAPKVYQCKKCAYWSGGNMGKCIPKMTEEAATALETLHAENRRLNELICSIPTTPDSGRTIGEYDKEMSMCAFLDDLEAENEKLRKELEQVKAERDAAVADVAAILAEMEEIRRGYGVDNADADNALADLCGNYCAKNGHGCYKEAGNYSCKNFEWCGIRED